MGYQVEGSILEVCNCNVLCPCWIGEDADRGTCDAVVAWHVDRGKINGVDVAGRTLAVLVHIPGNILQGNWKALVAVDDGASPEQQSALLDVWTGKLGGPVADLAGLIGEVVGVERVPIGYEVKEGVGTLRIGADSARPLVAAELSAYKGATGQATTLNDTVFSTIPGSPAYPAKASTYKRNSSQYGLKDIDLSGHNAVQGSFRFEG
jgi:hypothetical protein